MRNRSGSYKKILIDTETLKAHGSYLREALEDIKNQCQKMDLLPADFATLYLLLYLRLKHPKNWLQKKSSALKSASGQKGPGLICMIPESFNLNEWEKEKLEEMTPIDFFRFYNLKAIPESINRTMINWYEGRWSIKLLEHIPTPRELLRLQVLNTRCVSVITHPQHVDRLVFETRDPLSFLLHDLMHADQFFSQHESLKGQLGFYQLINAIYDRPELITLLATDKEFKKEFEYVASDMNAYVIHLFKCLKSSVYRTKESEIFFNLILNWWHMNEEQKKSSYLLNTPHFDLENEMVLKNFFEAQQELV